MIKFLTNFRISVLMSLWQLNKYPDKKKNRAKKYLATSEEGISGVEHQGIGKNLAQADFRVYIDVSNYAACTYTLGTLLMCMHQGSEVRVAYRFPDTLNFGVRGGEVITPMRIASPGASPEASATPAFVPAQTPAA